MYSSTKQTPTGIKTMNHKLYISDRLLKQSKRWAHQVNRLDKVWNCISKDDKPEKGERMRRTLNIQEAKRARMAVTFEVILMGVEL